MQDRRLKIQIKTKNQQNRMLFVPVNFYQLPVNSRNCEKKLTHTHTHKRTEWRVVFSWLGLFEIKLRDSLCDFSHDFFAAISLFRCGFVSVCVNIDFRHWANNGREKCCRWITIHLVEKAGTQVAISWYGCAFFLGISFCSCSIKCILPLFETHSN